MDVQRTEIVQIIDKHDLAWLMLSWSKKAIKAKSCDRIFITYLRNSTRQQRGIG